MRCVWNCLIIRMVQLQATLHKCSLCNRIVRWRFKSFGCNFDPNFGSKLLKRLDPPRFSLTEWIPIDIDWCPIFGLVWSFWRPLNSLVSTSCALKFTALIWVIYKTDMKPIYLLYWCYSSHVTHWSTWRWEGCKTIFLEKDLLGSLLGSFTMRLSLALTLSSLDALVVYLSLISRSPLSSIPLTYLGMSVRTDAIWIQKELWNGIITWNCPGGLSLTETLRPTWEFRRALNFRVWKDPKTLHWRISINTIEIRKQRVRFKIVRSSSRLLDDPL